MLKTNQRPEEIPNIKYSVKSAAKKLAVSHVKVYRLISSGKLRAYKFDGLTRISEEDLLNFIKKSAT